MYCRAVKNSSAAADGPSSATSRSTPLLVVAQPEPRRREGEARVVGRDPEVGAGRDGEPAADAYPVDHGDDRLLDPQQRREGARGDGLVDGRRGGVPAVRRELRDVGPGREGLLARSPQDENPDRRIGLEVADHVRKRLPHLEPNGVEPGRIPEAHPDDAGLVPLHVEAELIHGEDLIPGRIGEARGGPAMAPS